jgi:hypothetical protein
MLALEASNGLSKNVSLPLHIAFPLKAVGNPLEKVSKYNVVNGTYYFI